MPTWEQLAEEINAMSEDEKKSDATVVLVDSDVVMPVMLFRSFGLRSAPADEKNIVDNKLEEWQPYMVVDA